MSFCIPVYKNAEAAFRIVNDLLVSDDERFEVIVCDNASKDNTQEILAQIHDPRFKYYRNDKNIGAHKNWEHTLSLGSGEYLYLVMGRDKMHGENIGSLIHLLEEAQKNNVTYMKDRGRPQTRIRQFYEGIDALSAFVDYNHPTGSIFYRKFFMEIPNREHYFEISDMYPETYAARDLLLKGKGAFINSGVFYGGIVIDKTKTKSTVEHDINLFDTYFAPKRRTLQFYEFIDMVDPELAQRFTPDELNKYFGVKFYSLLENVSFWWYTNCRSPIQMAHYGQQVRYVTVSEMVRNMFNAYRDAKAHLKEKGTYTPQKDRTMRMCIAKGIPCLTTKALAKHYGNKLLGPLGIWDALRVVKSKLKPSRLP